MNVERGENGSDGLASVGCQQIALTGTSKTQLRMKNAQMHALDRLQDNGGFENTHVHKEETTQKNRLRLLSDYNIYEFTIGTLVSDQTHAHAHTDM